MEFHANIAETRGIANLRQSRGAASSTAIRTSQLPLGRRYHLNGRALGCHVSLLHHFPEAPAVGGPRKARRGFVGLWNSCFSSWQMEICSTNTYCHAKAEKRRMDVAWNSRIPSLLDLNSVPSVPFRQIEGQWYWCFPEASRSIGVSNGSCSQKRPCG